MRPITSTGVVSAVAILLGSCAPAPDGGARGLADIPGAVIYRGVVSIDKHGQTNSVSVTFSLVRGVDEVSGSWIADDGRTSGTISGGVLETGLTMMRVTQQHPCSAEFIGVARMSGDGTAFGGWYGGQDCDDHLVEATFRVERHR